MNYSDAIDYGKKNLKNNNIDTYEIDSELLLSKILNLSRERVLINLNNKLNKKYFHNYKKLILRRKLLEPIAYILKKKEFWKNMFFIDYDALIPRPETEIIVEEALKSISNERSINILDIGTGSGCIIISLIKDRPNCYGTAIDICKKALKIAIYNAKIHHLGNKIKFINIDIDKFKHNKYDLIVSNPPYISSINLKRLDNNVRFYEPIVALEAGVDGFREIRKLILNSKKLLKKNGKLIFEIGKNQALPTKNMLNKNNFYVNKICKDMQSIPRVFIATKTI